MFQSVYESDTVPIICDKMAALEINMIHNIKMFTADIDNTLRGKRMPVPGPLTLSAMEEMHRKGILLGIASGRPLWQEVQNHAHDWGLSFQFDFLIGMNGGEIEDTHKKTIEKYNLLTRAQLKTIATAMDEKFHLNPFVYRDGFELSLHMDNELRMSSLRHHSKIEICSDISDLWSMDTGKILYRCDTEKTAEEAEQFGKQFGNDISCFRTSPTLVEIQSAYNSKGAAIHQYCKDNHIDLSTVIAFGDAENDLEMLKAAGWAVCLHNGMDLCKAASDDITEHDSDDDGVGHYLYDHILNQ